MRATLSHPTEFGLSFVKARVLVVDDNSAGRYAIARHLRQAGHDVQESGTGEEALRLLAAEPAQLVILDVGLCDISGLEVCRRIKANPATALIPVIHVSATFVRGEDRARGLEGGADAYLAEPIDPRELLAYVQALLRVREAEAAALRQNRRLQMLATAAEQLLSGTHNDYTQRMRDLFALVAPELKLEAYINYIFDDRTETLYPGPYGGIPDEVARNINVHEADYGLAGGVAQTRVLAAATDLQRSADPKLQFLKRLGFRSCVCLPLLSGTRLLGTLSFGSQQKDSFEENDLTFLRTISHYVALARERALALQDMELMIQERTASLQATVGELESLSYSLAHDMRAPLRAMHGFAQLLRDDAETRLNEESQDYLRRIISSAQRLDLMIQEVLNYTTIVRSGLPLKPVNVHALLRELIESYPAFQPPGAEIHLTGILPEVVGNASALTQCFSHLLSNAVKFVSSGTIPQIHIRALRHESTARIWFEDNGIGISPEHQDRIFNLFERLHGPQEYQGTGIGLAVVRKAVQRMGGQVGVVSQAGQGSRFWIELPLASAAPT